MKTSLIIVTAVLGLAACASTTKPGTVGVNRVQLLTVPAAEIDAAAVSSYAAQNQKAQAAGALITRGPELARLKNIAAKLQAHVPAFRDDTRNWKWEVALIDAPILNATCAPGGKITFYTGIVRKLKLTDDEIAMVMGHEIAHALREHARERVSQAHATNAAASLAVSVFKQSTGKVLLAGEVAHYLFALPNSRVQESEADSMGLELAARAGYKPEAAVTFWEKMSAAGGAAPPEFLSTHPANATRIADLKAMVPKVSAMVPKATATVPKATALRVAAAPK